MKRTKKEQHKAPFVSFFARLRADDTFENLLNKNIIIPPVKNTRKMTTEEQKEVIKSERKERVKAARKILKQKKNKILGDLRRRHGKIKSKNTEETVVNKKPTTQLIKRYYEAIHITTWGNDPYTPPPMEE